MANYHEGKAPAWALVHAVCGATARHNKCVKILLEFGTDVNVKQSYTGKRLLHYAIEHREFKGYRDGSTLF